MFAVLQIAFVVWSTCGR